MQPLSASNFATWEPDWIRGRSVKISLAVAPRGPCRTERQTHSDHKSGQKPSTHHPFPSQIFLEPLEFRL